MLMSSHITVSDLPLLYLTRLPFLTRARLGNHGIVRPCSHSQHLLCWDYKGAEWQTPGCKTSEVVERKLVVEGWEWILGQMHRPLLSTNVAKKPALCLVLKGRSEDGLE